MMTIAFTKMQALGNDFVIIDNSQDVLQLDKQTIKAWANRHRGIGFDQLLVFKSNNTDSMEFLVNIYNADGGEVYQCGNGLRCVASCLYKTGLATQSQFTLVTQTNKHKVEVSEQNVSINMGQPILKPELIPFNVDNQAKAYRITISGQAYEVSAVSMGNPHCILFTRLNGELDIETIGEKINREAYFPEGVNVSLVDIISENHIKLAIYERGSGVTQACGSAACAAVVASHLHDYVNDTVTVSMPGGDVSVTWQSGDSPVWLRGEAVMVFKGEI